MGAKPIAKSIRMSQEAYDFLMKQPGEGFNEKYEKMIETYRHKLPEIDKKAKKLEKDIEEKEKTLRQLVKKIYLMDKLYFDLEELKKKLNSVNNTAADIIELAKVELGHAPRVNELKQEEL